MQLNRLKPLLIIIRQRKKKSKNSESKNHRKLKHTHI